MADSTARTPNYVFRDEGDWDPEKLRGGVYEVPAVIRTLKVNAIHAEWLSSYEDGDQDFSKNHMSFRLSLARPYSEEGVNYHAVMLSMEPKDGVTGDDIVEGCHEVRPTMPSA